MMLNTVKREKGSVVASLRMLKSGGLFLAACGFSPQTRYYEPSEQTNLSAADAVRVFGSRDYIFIVAADSRVKGDPSL